MFKRYKEDFKEKFETHRVIFEKIRERSLKGENSLSLIDEYFDRDNRRTMIIMYGIFLRDKN